jgi:TonB family protein
MKLCPTCQRAYEDDALRFCLEDGTALVSAEGSAHDPGATIKIPAGRVTRDAPTELMGEDRPALTRAERPAAGPAPRDERGYGATPPPAARKSSAAPWILGAAVVLGLSAIAVAVIMTRGDNSASTEVAQSNVNVDASPAVNTSPSLNDGGHSGHDPSPLPSAPDAAPESATPNRTPTATPTPTAGPSRTPVERPTPPPTPTPGPVESPAPRRSGPVSGGVLNGKAISLPKPAYPPIAKAARASGAVTVQVTIDESGNVIAARAVGGHPLLQQSAVQAARQARFSPTKVDGQPVKVTGVITYNFVAQ